MDKWCTDGRIPRLPGMTVHDERPRLRLRTVDDALGLIPHLLGFHPQESLVVLVVDGGQVAVTARIDLQDAAPPDGVEAVLERIWRRFPLADGWFVAYTGDHGAGWEVLGRCEAFLPLDARRRLTLVDGDSWWIDEPGGPAGRPSRPTGRRRRRCCSGSRAPA